MARPPSVKFVKSVLNRVQRYKRWNEMFLGNCGPAAVAINEILLAGEGQYLVVLHRSPRGGFPHEWKGHVAVLYKRKIFDYHGLLGWDDLAWWSPRRYADASLQPMVLVDVKEDEILRRFVAPAESKAPEIARRCLVRGRREELKDRKAA